MTNRPTPGYAGTQAAHAPASYPGRLPMATDPAPRNLTLDPGPNLAIRGDLTHFGPSMPLRAYPKVKIPSWQAPTRFTLPSRCPHYRLLEAQGTRWPDCQPRYQRGRGSAARHKWLRIALQFRRPGLPRSRKSIMVVKWSHSQMRENLKPSCS